MSHFTWNFKMKAQRIKTFIYVAESSLHKAFRPKCKNTEIGVVTGHIKKESRPFGHNKRVKCRKNNLS